MVRWQKPVAHQWYSSFTKLCNEVYRVMHFSPLKGKAMDQWYKTWKLKIKVPFILKVLIKCITGLAFWKSLSDHKGHDSSWPWTAYDSSIHIFPEWSGTNWSPSSTKAGFQYLEMSKISCLLIISSWSSKHCISKRRHSYVLYAIDDLKKSMSIIKMFYSTKICCVATVYRTEVLQVRRKKHEINSGLHYKNQGQRGHDLYNRLSYMSLPWLMD